MRGPYSRQSFPEALEAYGEAIELDNTNMSFVSNRAAVYFEQKEYETCIAEVSPVDSSPLKSAVVVATQGMCLAHQRDRGLQLCPSQHPPPTHTSPLHIFPCLFSVQEGRRCWQSEPGGIRRHRQSLCTDGKGVSKDGRQGTGHCPPRERAGNDGRLCTALFSTVRCGVVLLGVCKCCIPRAAMLSTLRVPSKIFHY